MRPWLRWTLIATAIVLIAIQFFPVDRTNPPVDPAKSFYATENVPQKLQNVFRRSCSDCHSNQTNWPWYTHVAPVSWLVAHDVHEGRRKLNFSQWGDYPAKKRDHKTEEICNNILDSEMPDSKYTLIHRNARLTEDEREAICKWTGSPH
ncbi:MAG: heme-binding domain-containing protein [Candidatus Sulfotelmatobacter sp.]